MAIQKEKKHQVVEELSGGLKNADTTFFTDFTGISVNKLNELRRTIRESGGRYYVAKHTLVKLAFDRIEFKVDEGLIDGVNGLVMVTEDPVGTAKILKSFKDDNNTFAIKGGLLGHVFLSGDDVIQLAKTPPREELLAKMLGSMNAPITGFVGVSAGIIRKMMYALNAVAETKSE